jgi:O-antigen/teichoic acid export membrane protein
MSVSPYSGAALSRSAGHFIVGKSISALLTLIILFWLVRLLSVEEYGAYVTFVAGMELTLVLTGFGLPWVAARYLPESRLHASGNMLTHLVWQIIGRLSLSLLGGALLLAVIMPWLLTLLGLSQHTDVARVYLVVLLMDGLGRNTRDFILGPLLQQGVAQRSLAMRNFALLLLLSMAAAQGPVHLADVVLAEVAAAALGALLALRGLLRYLQAHRHLRGNDGWRPPDWAEMWRIARHMYASHLVSLIYSANVLIFLIQRYLGVEATALFGFLYRLYIQTITYLPATLLFSVIRPKLIASYVGMGGMGELTRNANLAGKLSLFVLMPVLVFVGLAGNELLSLLSGGKFPQAGNYLAVLLIALIPFSQRQILETVAVASNMSQLCFLGGLLGTLALPLAYWLLKSGQGLWGPVAAVMIGELIFNTTLIAALARATTYRPDAIGLIKLMAAALAAFEVTRQTGLASHDWLDLFIMAALACGFFLLISYFIKPFQIEERDRMNRLLKRRVFVW